MICDFVLPIDFFVVAVLSNSALLVFFFLYIAVSRSRKDVPLHNPCSAGQCRDNREQHGLCICTCTSTCRIRPRCIPCSRNGPSCTWNGSTTGPRIWQYDGQRQPEAQRRSCGSDSGGGATCSVELYKAL